MSEHDFGNFARQAQMVEMQQMQMNQMYMNMAAGIYTQLAAHDIVKSITKLDDEISQWEMSNDPENPSFPKPEEIKVNCEPLLKISFHYAQAFMHAITKK